MSTYNRSQKARTHPASGSSLGYGSSHIGPLKTPVQDAPSVCWSRSFLAKEMFKRKSLKEGCRQVATLGLNLATPLKPVWNNHTIYTLWHFTFWEPAGLAFLSDQSLDKDSSYLHHWGQESILKVKGLLDL